MSAGKVLVTGGAGYIGSTVSSALLDAGYTPIILDNLSLGPVEFTRGRIFYQGDIADHALIQRIAQEQGKIHATIHCAALIVVPESVSTPDLYYRENVGKSIELFAALRDIGCERVVFSSSAAVYGAADDFMFTEDSPLRPSNPYARTKLMMEMVLQDYTQAFPMRALALRYFNPIGADPKMRTGAYLKNPTHVLGKIMDAAHGRIPMFEMTGTDWPTRDGSGLRDFIHIWDLAQAHVAAVKRFDDAFRQMPQARCLPINLGTGKGVTVRELLAAVEKVLGRKVPMQEKNRRPGDIAGCYASASRAEKLLGWKASLPMEEGIRSSLAWSEKWLSEGAK